MVRKTREDYHKTKTWNNVSQEVQEPERLLISVVRGAEGLSMLVVITATQQYYHFFCVFSRVV